MSGPHAMILAGGGARRMGGGDKGLLALGGGTVLGQVVARIEPQVTRLALNANGDPARFAALGLPVRPDTIDGQLGPLAGILTAMDWAHAHGAASVFTVAGDTPFLPGDLIPRLMLAAEDAPSGMAIATSDGRAHPTCGLWPIGLADDLRRTLQNGTRRLTDWTDKHTAAMAPFPATKPDPFFNINTPDDLVTAREFL